MSEIKGAVYKPLYFNEYQELAQRTANKKQDLKLRLAVAGLGISGEAGEVSDYLKKHLGHGHEMDIDKLGKELGDVLWYIAEIGHIIGYPLEQIAKDNIEKLNKRYKDGFSVEASINRID